MTIRAALMSPVMVVALGAFSGATALAAQEAAKAADAKAEEIYKQKCIVCHAADGNSPLPNMSFADGVWKHGSSVKEVVKTINDGVPGTAMMPFKGQFSAQEIQALARYVRKFDPKLAASTTKTKAPTKKPAA